MYILHATLSYAYKRSPHPPTQGLVGVGSYRNDRLALVPAESASPPDDRYMVPIPAFSPDWDVKQ